MNRFTDNGDNTVTDTQTGLIWSKETVAKDMTHEAATKAVEEMGDGWRLPTVQELFTLVDHSRELPAIDIEAFPDTDNDWYWTSTPTAWITSAAWVVNFSNGNVSYLHRLNKACVRAVRASQ